MLWAPNSRFGGVGDTRGGYSQYWPGVKYVDILGEHSRTNVFFFVFLFFGRRNWWVWHFILTFKGISFYHYGGQLSYNQTPTIIGFRFSKYRLVDLSSYPQHPTLGFDRNNVLPASQEAVKMIKEFSDVSLIDFDFDLYLFFFTYEPCKWTSWTFSMILTDLNWFLLIPFADINPSCESFLKLYAIPNDLPLVLSETGASFTRSLQTGQPAPGGASEYDMKLQWLKQLLSSDITNAAPRFKAFLWVSVFLLLSSSFYTIKDESMVQVISTSIRMINWSKKAFLLAPLNLTLDPTSSKSKKMKMLRKSKSVLFLFCLSLGTMISNSEILQSQIY